MNLVDEIFSFLSAEFQSLSSQLVYKHKTETIEELIGKKPMMQGKQMVDGYYFATIMKKEKDVRLYFFPIYTHDQEFSYLSPELRKMLKGKSCFHIKKIDDTLKAEISNMLQQGLDLYTKADLV